MPYNRPGYKRIPFRAQHQATREIMLSPCAGEHSLHRRALAETSSVQQSCSNRNSRALTHGQSQTFPHLLQLSHIHSFHSIKCLQQPDQQEARFSQCELLADTDSRSTQERRILPCWDFLLPTAGPELQRIFTPEVCTSVHCVDTEHHRLPSANGDG